MALWRCTYEGCKAGDFESPIALCPECGNYDPVPLVTIHFDPPHRKDPRRTAREPACQPGRSLDALREVGVNEPAAVSCPRCKAWLRGRTT